MGEAADPGFALLGAGIYARGQYLHVLEGVSDCMSLKAFWSRSKERAEAMVRLAQDFAPTAEAKWGEEGLEEVLKDTSIHGVVVVLPFQIQLDIVSRALKAGKHVLQAKPVGPTVAEACKVLHDYDELRDSGMRLPIWAVAESFRFETALLVAADMVKSIGEILNVQVIGQISLPPTSAGLMDPAVEV